MGKVRPAARSSKRPKAAADGDTKPDANRDGEIRPYYEETRGVPSDAWNAELKELVGFDIVAMHERLLEWLQAHGYQREAEGGRGIPEEEDAKTDDDRKARAVFKAIMRLINLREMWAPERIAARRWHMALVALEEHARDAKLAASVRVREDGFILGRSAGETAQRNYGKRYEQTRGIIRALGALERRARNARQWIPRYLHDTLSDAGAVGRPSKMYLGSVELDLKLAKFALAEIAALSEGHSRNKAAAADRARKRIADAKANRAALEQE